MSRNPAGREPIATAGSRLRQHLVVGRLGFLIGLVIPILALAAGGAFIWHQLQANEHNDGFLTPQYQAVTFDEPRPSIIHHLGKPLLAARTYPLTPNDELNLDLGQPPSGSLCDYYGEEDTIQDPGEMRLCYQADRLVEKASYDIEVDAPQKICVWRPSSRTPACRNPKP